MSKKDIKELTELEFEEVLLTVMVGVYVRTAVLDNRGRSWKKIDEHVKLFLHTAENLGFKKLVEYYNKAILPKESLCKREEKIIENYGEDEFWEELKLRLGQRDFFMEITEEELKNQKKMPWLSNKINEYYEKYEEEFIEQGIERLQIVKKGKD